jgi:hypothetical protein
MKPSLQLTIFNHENKHRLIFHIFNTFQAMASISKFWRLKEAISSCPSGRRPAWSGSFTSDSADAMSCDISDTGDTLRTSGTATRRRGSKS